MTQEKANYSEFIDGNTRTNKSYVECKSDFIKMFNRLASHKGRYEVFADFITMSAISLNNALIKNQTLEEEFLNIAKRYSKEEYLKISQLFAIVQMALDLKPFDVLGDLFMSLDFGSKHNGQFFTPHHISVLMANLTHGESLKNIETPFVSLSDPACGAGSMILAYVEMLHENGHNPSQKLFVQAVDIDRVVALMCFIQLTLWDVPAEVIVGNTLTLEYREYWYTFAYKRCGWSYKLKNHYQNQVELETAKQAIHLTDEKPVVKNQPIKPVAKSFQLDLF